MGVCGGGKGGSGIIERKERMVLAKLEAQGRDKLPRISVEQDQVFVCVLEGRAEFRRGWNEDTKVGIIMRALCCWVYTKKVQSGN